MQGIRVLAGIDEVGRGPLAGPVVAAAVIFPSHQSYINGINDSKKLSPWQREKMVEEIKDKAMALMIGMASEQEIDEINILRATHLAMHRAVASLSMQPEYLLIDGRDMPFQHLPGKAVVKGDCLSMSIAAASIIAKVTRDHIMREYDSLFPQYGFARHKGYSTQLHIQAIRTYGFCPIHRRSFKPKALLNCIAEKA